MIIRFEGKLTKNYISGECSAKSTTIGKTVSSLRRHSHEQPIEGTITTNRENIFLWHITV